jgi:hypothetical protein
MYYFKKLAYQEARVKKQDLAPDVLLLLVEWAWFFHVGTPF